MKEVIRFDILHGRCAICEGPIYFTKCVDWEGSRVNALQCWNGHYEELEIEHVYVENNGEDLTPEQIEEILPFVGFVKVKDENSP